MRSPSIFRRFAFPGAQPSTYLVGFPLTRSSSAQTSSALTNEFVTQQNARASPDLLIYRVASLRSPQLDEVIAIENEAFPACERLGARLMQHHAVLRTSGLLLAEVRGLIAGYVLYTRSADSGLIAKVAVASHFRRRGVGTALLRQVVGPHKWFPYFDAYSYDDNGLCTHRASLISNMKADGREQKR